MFFMRCLTAWWCQGWLVLPSRMVVTPLGQRTAISPDLWGSRVWTFTAQNDLRISNRFSHYFVCFFQGTDSRISKLVIHGDWPVVNWQLPRTESREAMSDKVLRKQQPKCGPMQNHCVARTNIGFELSCSACETRHRGSTQMQNVVAETKSCAFGSQRPNISAFIRVVQQVIQEFFGIFALDGFENFGVLGSRTPKALWWLLGPNFWDTGVACWTSKQATPDNCCAIHPIHLLGYGSVWNNNGFCFRLLWAVFLWDDAPQPHARLQAQFVVNTLCKKVACCLYILLGLWLVIVKNLLEHRPNWVVRYSTNFTSTYTFYQVTKSLYQR